MAMINHKLKYIRRPVIPKFKNLIELIVNMVQKIIDKLNMLMKTYPDGLHFSYEFFPPKTEAGMENLHQRIERMTSLEPLFVDFTWGTGLSTRDLTMQLCEYSQKYLGLDVLMHLTCTNLTVNDLRDILNAAKSLGIKNILALRGDLPKGAYQWQSFKNGLSYAIDLVRLIREEFRDYFCIGIAGFPEGNPQSVASDNDILYLKQKVDAGADFIITQFFYSTKVFIEFVTKCRRQGITCPIIPGMMPIQSYSSLEKMTRYCKTHVPEFIWNDLLPIRDNDEEVKAYGVDLCMKMCNEIRKELNCTYFHFYTLNLEKSVLSILRGLGVEDMTAKRRKLPWRGSRTNLKGLNEDVRPINWANRPKSYIQRTVTWDEFPNGRWGDGRSPAFGELSNSHFFKSLGTKEERLQMWGDNPLCYEDIYDVFAKYVEGKIPILPWCESSLQLETNVISKTLANINRRGFLTINSQPAVNGEKSDHPIYGWGGAFGRVYQKAYVEFFVSPSNLQLLLRIINTKPNLSLHAVNYSKDSIFGANDKGATAVTWGVFPNREIIQPTVFDHDIFIVWYVLNYLMY